ncbi:MAG: type II toxin-antitoxin system Phd/YefM family antitoxin [Chloroflexota bacterium]|nr:type II toxin-antitoxin system Phd/YefM family antitoxin [Chloroflexota bacterium]
MTQWALQDAKNRFSAVVDAALQGEPQTVTRRGVPAVVVLAVGDYQLLRRAETASAPTFVEHLLAIPKGGPDEVFERASGDLRDVEW